MGSPLICDHMREKQKELHEAEWPSGRSRQEICLDSEMNSLWDLGQVLFPM